MADWEAGRKAEGGDWGWVVKWMAERVAWQVVGGVG